MNNNSGYDNRSANECMESISFLNMSVLREPLKHCIFSMQVAPSRFLLQAIGVTKVLFDTTGCAITKQYKDGNCSSRKF